MLSRAPSANNAQPYTLRKEENGNGELTSIDIVPNHNNLSCILLYTYLTDWLECGIVAAHAEIVLGQGSHVTLTKESVHVSKQ